MSDKRIVVPDAMLRVACRAYPNPSFDWADDEHYGVFTRTVLEAALRWLSENPIIPTDGQAFDLFNDLSPSGVSHWNQAMWAGFVGKCAIEWQRRMFLAPEQEESPKTFTIDQIEDAFRDTYSGGDYHPSAVWNKMRVNLGIAPEPQVQEEIKDLLLPEDVENGFFRPDTVNERMRECFRRGKKAVSK